MNKINLLIVSITLLFCDVSFGQSTFRIGPVYSIGISTILTSDDNMNGMNQSVNSNQMNVGFSLKSNIGTAIRAEYNFPKRWGIYLQTGYQQRGAVFKEYMDDFKPRYTIHNWDVNMGVQFRTRGIMKEHQFVTNLGLTQHTLLSVSRVYDTGSDNIKNDFNSNGFGVFLGVGENIPMFEKDILQILLYTNYGFTQLYSGNLEMNGMSGKNFLLGVQLGYLIGRPLK